MKKGGIEPGTVVFCLNCQATLPSAAPPPVHLFQKFKCFRAYEEAFAFSGDPRAFPLIDLTFCCTCHSWIEEWMRLKEELVRIEVELKKVSLALRSRLLESMAPTLRSKVKRQSDQRRTPRHDLIRSRAAASFLPFVLIQDVKTEILTIDFEDAGQDTFDMDYFTVSPAPFQPYIEHEMDQFQKSEAPPLAEFSEVLEKSDISTQPFDEESCANTSPPVDAVEITILGSSWFHCENCPSVFTQEESLHLHMQLSHEETAGSANLPRSSPPNSFTQIPLRRKLPVNLKVMQKGRRVKKKGQKVMEMAQRVNDPGKKTTEKFDAAKERQGVMEMENGQDTEGSGQVSGDEVMEGGQVSGHAGQRVIEKGQVSGGPGHRVIEKGQGSGGPGERVIVKGQGSGGPGQRVIEKGQVSGELGQKSEEMGQEVNEKGQKRKKGSKGHAKRSLTQTKHRSKSKKKVPKQRKVGSIHRTDDGKLWVDDIELIPIGAKQFKCGKCAEKSIVYKSRHNVRLHVNLVHFKRKSKVFFGPPTIRQHLKDNSVKVSEKKTLLGGIELVQLENGTWNCGACSLNFAVKCTILTHVRLKHLNLPMYHSKTFTCDICGKDFRGKGALDQHRVHHLDERNFTCEECGASTKTAHNLKLHIERVHAKVVKHACEVCGKGFYATADLKQHLCVVHGIGTIVRHHCICGNTYRFPNGLARHRRKCDMVKAQVAGADAGVGACADAGVGAGASTLIPA